MTIREANGRAPGDCGWGARKLQSGERKSSGGWREPTITNHQLLSDLCPCTVTQTPECSIPFQMGLAMASELTWRQAIAKVLGESTTPLHYNEITERIIRDGLRKSLGATPSATVNAHIAASIKRDGVLSPYLRVTKGTYILAKPTTSIPPTPSSKLTPTIPESEEFEEQYEIITSFGMFWRRNAIVTCFRDRNAREPSTNLRCCENDPCFGSHTDRGIGTTTKSEAWRRLVRR